MPDIPVYTAQEVQEIVQAALEAGRPLPLPEPAWKPLKEAPRDGTPVVMLSLHTCRWSPYLKEAEDRRNVEVVSGVRGRWQVYHRGTWNNLIKPHGLWQASE